MNVSALHKGAKKGMLTPLFNERLVKSVLRLTDPGIQSRADASKVLGAARRGRRLDWSLDGPASFSIDDWDLARQWLQEWLPQIRGYRTASKAKREEVVEAINKILYAHSAGPMIKASADGFAIEVDDWSTWAAAALAMLPFLGGVDDWSPTRLAQCRNSTCGRWFLRPPPRRGSQPEYCSPSHASSERVRRFRQAARKPK